MTHFSALSYNLIKTNKKDFMEPENKQIKQNKTKKKTLESSLDCKEIQQVHPKGDQSWLFIGRTDVEVETPILWPPHVKS